MMVLTVNLGLPHSLDKKIGFINDGVIEKITCPTLILHRRIDNSVPFINAVHAHSSIVNSELFPLDNEWGHLIWVGKDSSIPIRKTVSFINPY